MRFLLGVRRREEKFGCLPSRCWGRWRREESGVKVGEDGVWSRREERLAGRPGPVPRARLRAVRRPGLHQPLGAPDSRGTGRRRPDSGKIRLQEHGTGESLESRSDVLSPRRLSGGPSTSGSTESPAGSPVDPPLVGPPSPPLGLRWTLH